MRVIGHRGDGVQQGTACNEHVELMETIGNREELMNVQGKDPDIVPLLHY